jgi:methionyl-tRNA synthetase
VFQVKMGTEVRQVISGVAESFTPEEMLNKKVVVVANLKPRMLRGLESYGMILYAGEHDGLHMVTTDCEDGESVN